MKNRLLLIFVFIFSFFSLFSVVESQSNENYSSFQINLGCEGEPVKFIKIKLADSSHFSIDNFLIDEKTILFRLNSKVYEKENIYIFEFKYEYRPQELLITGIKQINQKILKIMVSPNMLTDFKSVQIDNISEVQNGK